MIIFIFVALTYIALPQLCSVVTWYSELCCTHPFFFPYGVGHFFWWGCSNGKAL